MSAKFRPRGYADQSRRGHRRGHAGEASWRTDVGEDIEMTLTKHAQNRRPLYQRLLGDALHGVGAFRAGRYHRCSVTDRRANLG
jgi:hypothetical protein